jgi:hypothetical protein
MMPALFRKENTMTTTTIEREEMITQENAAEAKRRIHSELRTQSPLHPPQHWLSINFANTDAALAWLNTNPVQSAGEVAATARNDGSVSMLTIMPPTSPLQSPQRWFYRDFASPNDAVFYLNEAPAQSDGEVSATLRNNGHVGVFYIAPA